MAFSAIVAVGVATQVYSTIQQADAAKDAANAQKQQIAVQKQQAELQNLQSTRAMARERYRASARVLNIGALTGTSASSGVQGGVSSINSQLAGNLSYMSDSADLKEQEFGAAMSYASAQQRIGEAQTMGQVGAAFGSLGNYFKR